MTCNRIHEYKVVCTCMCNLNLQLIVDLDENEVKSTLISSIFCDIPK